MQNTKKVFTLFLRIIHTDFRSSYWEASTLKGTLNQFLHTLEHGSYITPSGMFLCE